MGREGGGGWVEVSKSFFLEKEKRFLGNVHMSIFESLIIMN